MAKKLKEAIDLEAEEPTLEAPTPEEPDASAEDVVLQYIGPVYDKGIELHGTRRLIRPAEFTQEGIQRFLEQHPNKAHWWAPANKL